jgi:Domain of unknown function (DUF4476)
MKSVFTFLATLLSIVVMAGNNDGKLTISSTNNSNIRVMVDGNQYSRSGGTIVIRNLNPGIHQVRVFQKRPDVQNSPFNRSAYRQIYSAQLLIKPRFHTDITVSRFGKVLIDEVMMDIAYNDDDDDDECGSNNGNGGWNNGNGNGNGGWNNGNGNGNGGWNNGNGNGGWNNGNGGWNNTPTMNNRNFELFKQTLRNESMDNSRATIARQTISSNRFTSAQVKEMVTLFSFESNRLEIAKFAYQYTVDRNSYFIINDAFSFSSSKEELANYIRNFR